MAVSKVIIACVLIGMLSRDVSSQPTKRLIHLGTKQRPLFPLFKSRGQALSKSSPDRKSDKNRPSISCSRSSSDSKKAFVIYHLPKPLELHDTFDIIIKSKHHVKSSSISLMTEDQKTACTLKIISDDHQSKSRQLIREKLMRDEEKCTISIPLYEFLHDSNIKVSFTVRQNVQTSETNTLEIGGKSSSISAIEIDEDIEMGDIKFLKIVGDGLAVAELNFKFDLFKEP